MRRMSIRVLKATLLAVACALPAVAQAPKPDPTRAFIEKQAVAFSEAFARGDFKALAAMYTEDALVLPPEGEIVTGAPAIEAFWKGVRDSGVKGATLIVTDVSSSGDMAAEVGKAVLTIKPPNQPELSQTVKYLVVWKRQKGGTWKLYRDIWNAMPPPAPKP